MNFFAPQLSEYKTEAENIKARDFKFSNYEEIMREQFHLAYFGRINYLGSDGMSVLERHTMYRMLVEQKKEEKKAQEEAMKSSGKKSWRKR